MTDSGVCQRSPVAISTASISWRANNSYWSAYMAQSWLPYFLSTVALDGLAPLVAHIADGHELHVGRLRKLFRSRAPRLPMPSPPTVTRSLGARPRRVPAPTRHDQRRRRDRPGPERCLQRLPPRQALSIRRHRRSPSGFAIIIYV